jgi:vanillate O-demethylase ferredoxin subunit
LTPELTFKVGRLTKEATDVISLHLAPADGSPLPVCPAGSHIRVRLGADLVRQYSLCNGPDDRSAYIIAVKKERASRGGSEAIHELRLSDEVRVSLPIDAFPVDWGAEHIVLLAGGIGVTPLISMARHALDRKHSFSLHYFARSNAEAAFSDALAECSFSGHVTFHYGLSANDTGARLADIISRAPERSHAYICGPRPFMERACGLAAERFGAASTHWEYFSGSDAPLAAAADHPFQIRMGRDGPTFTVPAGRTILQVIQAAGFEVDCSCLEGVCGMCITQVLEGEPDHRDEFLSDEAKRSNDVMTVCVSRSKSPLLVLDL